MPVQGNGEASRQQRLRNPMSAGNRKPQHGSIHPQHTPSKSSAGVRAHVSLQQSASSSTGVKNSQQKKWIKSQESGHAYNKMTTGSTIPVDPNNAGGCRPKSGNWRQQNFNSRAFDMSSTARFFFSLLKYSYFFKLLILKILYFTLFV